MRSTPCYSVVDNGDFRSFSTLIENANHSAQSCGGTVVPCVIVDRDHLEEIRLLLMKGRGNKVLEMVEKMLPRVYSLEQAKEWFEREGKPVTCIKERSSPIYADSILQAMTYYGVANVQLS